MRYDFYKEENGRWYVDLPEWTGDKSDLEMVEGADVLLDILLGEEYTHPRISVRFETEPFEGSHTLTYHEDPVIEGYYENDAWHGPSMIWLCSVTEFVFSYYPNKIYYSR
jgi:hypothetical protein